VNEIKMRPIYSNELMHHQVLGAKWHIRRYQNKDGSLTPLGRQHYGVGPPREVPTYSEPSTSGRRMSKKEQAAVQKATAERKKVDAAIESGSYRKIKKQAKNMTSDELNKAIDRAAKQETVNQKARETGESKAKTVLNELENVKLGATKTKELAQVGVDIYNIIASIYNSRNSDKKLPVIGERGSKTRDNSWIDELLESKDRAEIIKRTSTMSDSEVAELAKRVENLNMATGKVTKRK